jgi:hypothetical protein
VKEIDRRWLVPIAHRSASSQALSMLEAALRTVELPLAPGCECPRSLEASVRSEMTAMSETVTNL